MSTNWGEFFDAYAVKKVTWTDKNKGAYVPTVDQCRVIQRAGITPSNTRPAREFKIAVLNDDTLHVGTSFYHSQRLSDPSRAPEPRMGHAFISSWLKVGDTVLLGVVGTELFALKVDARASADDLGSRIADRASEKTVWARALLATGRPKRRFVTRDDFVRNPYVVKAALIRSGSLCEMPGCKTLLFQRDSGNNYVEVHHVIPLGEMGNDSLDNVAALCPHCHREQHFSRDRLRKKALLKAYVDKIPR